ncbi:MAG: DUF2271 domain-containing protein [Pseudomonadota bacterium]
MIKRLVEKLPLACALMLCAALVGGTVSAREIQVEFALPVIDTADYNKPYVAIWLELPERNETLLLWHLDRHEEDKWLPDIRRWWRKLGRYGATVDAVTGATRGPGKYRERFIVEEDGPFTLLLEVVREDGGRTLIKQQLDFSGEQRVFQLPPEKEIGATTITLGEE